MRSEQNRTGPKCANQEGAKMKVGFISLGCSKNLIDTEVAIGHFKNNKFEIVNNPEEADIIVINTCGFIESAKEEAIKEEKENKKKLDNLDKAMSNMPRYRAVTKEE